MFYVVDLNVSFESEGLFENHIPKQASASNTYCDCASTKHFIVLAWKIDRPEVLLW